MDLPNIFNLLHSYKVVSPVLLTASYGNLEKGDFKVTITPAEKKKQTVVEVMIVRSSSDNVEEKGLALILDIKGVTTRPIVQAIDDSKKNLNRLVAIGEHIVKFIEKLVSAANPSDKVIVATPYRGYGTKDYAKTILNISLMSSIEIQDHISTDLTLTKELLEDIENQLLNIYALNKFNEFL